MREDDSFYADLGRRVRAARDRQHITQQQLASELDPPSTRASIANIEAGKQRVLAHTLAQLARALSVSVADLLPNSDKQVGDAVHKELIQKLGPRKQVPRLLEQLAKSKIRRNG